MHCRLPLKTKIKNQAVVHNVLCVCERFCSTHKTTAKLAQTQLLAAVASTELNYETQKIKLKF